MLRSIIVVTVLTCALTAQAAPTQWAAGSGGNDHWYEVVLVAGGTTWGEAKTAAENAGGYLATLTSAEEHDFVVDLLPTGSPQGLSAYWLGGYQDPTDGPAGADWHWVTGETWSHTEWYSGEPNDDFSLDEDSLAIYGDSPQRGTWNDVHNSYLHHYVVEVVPEPATMSLLGLGAIALIRRKK